MAGAAAAGSVLPVDLGLRGSRALITGASRGIGFAVAEALAAEGAAVGLVARGAGGLASAAGRLARHGVPVATAAADVSDTAALQGAVAAIAAALGGLDYLVANAAPSARTSPIRLPAISRPRSRSMPGTPPS